MLNSTKAKQIISRTLKRSGIKLLKYSHLDGCLEGLKGARRSAEDNKFLKHFPNIDSSQILKFLPLSQAQFRQDLFVLSELNWKHRGYFVEFGAMDGIHFSNTHLLEKEFGWTGILSEPAQRWHEVLPRNRSCHINKQCVWRESNATLQFNETDEIGLSTVNSYTSCDNYSYERKRGHVYDVTTVSLEDLLTHYNAPTEIDYLSIDTEGSEFEILSAFDFSKRKFSVITVEHNFQPVRQKIFDLLNSHGYKRKFEALSQVDDWYVL